MSVPTSQDAPGYSGPVGAVFQTTLLDPSGRPDLIVGDTRPNRLVWTLANNVAGPGNDLVVEPFPSGPVGPTQYHFKFTFAPGALTAAPAVAGWSVATQTDGRDGITAVYLAFDGPGPLTIPAGQDHVTGWTYTTAIQENPLDPNVVVTLIAGTKVTVGGAPIAGKAYGPFDLRLVPNGAPTLSAPPIAVDVVGRRAVLNDGATPNAFTFALTNLTPADITLTPTIVGVGAGVPPTVLTVWFDAAPNDPTEPYAWALAQVQQLAASGVDVALPSADWDRTRTAQSTPPLGTVPGNPQWILTVHAPVVLPQQAPVLFTFSGIVTDLAPGIARMYVKYEGLPGYADGILIAELEKTPLRYGEVRGEGLFLSAGRYGGTTPPALDYTSGLHVQQYGAERAAVFAGGGGTVFRDAQGAAVQVVGTVGVDATGHAADGLLLTANGTAAGVHVTHAGTGPAVLVDGLLHVTGGATLVNATLSATLTAKGVQVLSDGLNVQGAATITGIVKAQNGLEVTGPGLSVSGGLTVESGVTTVKTAATIGGLLTASGGATLNGTVAAPGPFAVFGAYQARNVNQTYTAATDGFVVAGASWPNPWNPGLCVTSVNGYVNGQRVAAATGGEMGAFKVNSPSDYQSVTAANVNSIMFPVPRGATWGVGISSVGDNQYAASTWAYWIPLGTAQQLAADEAPADAPSPPQDQAPRTAQVQESDVQTSVADLVTVLADALGTSFTDDARQRLHAGIYKLVQLRPADGQ